MTRTTALAVLIALGSVGLIFLPVELPHSIDATARIMPAREWVLQRGNDGKLVASLYDHRAGYTDNYSVTEPQRGDAVSFELNHDVLLRGFVAAGDTIGRLYSNEIDRTLASLQGRLLIKQASLALYESGEKDAVVEEAERRLELARRELAEQESLTRRIRTLHERDLVSDEEYERAEHAVDSRSLSVSIAESQLRSVETGAKPEEVDLVRARIRALETELASVQRQADRYTLTSPFDGVLLSRVGHQHTDMETLVRIADTSAQVIIVPVEWGLRDYLAVNQRLHVQIEGGSRTLTGTIHHIDNTVQIIDGRQVVFATAAINPAKNDLVPGMLTRARIEAEPLTPLQHVTRFMNATVRP